MTNTVKKYCYKWMCLVAMMLSLLLNTACGTTSKITEPTTPPINSAPENNNQSDYTNTTPEISDKIIGKKIKIYAISSYEMSDFNAQGSFVIPRSSAFYMFSTVGSPTYSYVKSDKSTATLKMQYVEKLKIRSDITISTYTFDLKLRFNGTSEGTFTGQIKCVSTGFDNHTTTYSNGGIFELQ